MKVQISLVVEVVPWRFSERELPTEGPARLHPGPWGRYFTECLNDVGFSDVHPIARGSFMVPIRDCLAKGLLEQVINDHLKSLDVLLPDGSLSSDLDLNEDLAPLCGGYAISVEGHYPLLPQCCGDLGNVEEWLDVVESRPNRGEVWVGHPSIRVQFSDEHVKLEEGWEWGAAPEYLESVEIPIQAFVDGVEAAAAELRALIEPVAREVEELAGGVVQARDLAARLLGCWPQCQ